MDSFLGIIALSGQNGGTVEWLLVAGGNTTQVEVMVAIWL